MNDFNREQVIANSSFTKVAEHADKISNKFGAISDKMKSTGKTMSVGITAPIVAGFVSQLKQVPTLKRKCQK